MGIRKWYNEKCRSQASLTFKMNFFRCFLLDVTKIDYIRIPKIMVKYTAIVQFFHNLESEGTTRGMKW